MLASLLARSFSSHETNRSATLCSTHLHLGHLADCQFERTSLDVLVVQTESQREIALLWHDVHELVRPVLVVEYFPVHYAAIWCEHLEQRSTNISFTFISQNKSSA